jgi:hypothetical protein
MYLSSNYNDDYFHVLRLFFMLRTLKILLLFQEVQSLTRLLRVSYYNELGSHILAALPLKDIDHPVRCVLLFRVGRLQVLR